MSVTAINAVMERSRAKGKAWSVLIVLAEAVNEGQVQAGLPWEAWPMQETISYRMNLSVKKVGEALKELEASGEIRDLEKPVGKGAKTYELTLPESVKPRPESKKRRPKSNSEGDGRNTGSDLGMNPGSDHRSEQRVRSGRNTGSDKPEGNRKKGTGQKEPDTDQALRAGRPPVVPSDLPMLGEEQVTAYEFLDGWAIIDALNRLREKREGKKVKRWALLGPNGNLTPDGRVVVNRLRISPEHDVDSLIAAAKRCFAGDPPWWDGREPEGAAAIYAEFIFEHADGYRPDEPDWLERDPEPAW